MRAPVVLFAYKRCDHLIATIRALAANTLAQGTPLIIYSDAPRGEEDAPPVQAVREYLADISGFASVTIHKRAYNFGLADSIVDGVTTVVREYGACIVLEDDIVTSPYFLEYMNAGLEHYAHDEKVMHIAGHMLPIETKDLPESFFMRQSSCWGWATWNRAWQHFHRQGKIFMDSFTEEDIYRFNLDGAYDYWGQLTANEGGTLKTWAVYWYACIFGQGGLCLHPRQSLVQNIGFDGSGEHCGPAAAESAVARILEPKEFPELREEHSTAAERYQRHLRGPKPRDKKAAHGGWWRRIREAGVRLCSTN